MNVDLFKHLEEWSSMGDVLATVNWQEIPGPDERYGVNVVWRFRGNYVGEGQYIIHPVMNSDKWRVFWIGLAFVADWQNKGIYTNLVKSYAAHMLSYDIIDIVTVPWDTESERRLASQGFEWDGHEFVLDFAKVNES